MSNTKLDVRVYPIDEPKGNTRAFASVAIDDLIAIRGVRVVENAKGSLFVTMPQSQDKKTQEYHDIAFPVSGDLRKEINKSVLDEYKEMAGIPPEHRFYDKAQINAAPEKDLADIKLDIRVFPLDDPQGSTMAFASVSVDNLVAIRGIRVVDSANGLFVTMPQSQDKKTEEYHDIAFPLNGDLRKEISRAVLDKYENPEKTAERKSLADGLAAGAAKAAERGAAPRSAAKSRGAGVLE